MTLLLRQADVEALLSLDEVIEALRGLREQAEGDGRAALGQFPKARR